MIRWKAWMAAAALLFGCQGDPYPAPVLGSTWRIDKDVPTPGSEVTLDIFATESECANAKIDDLELCRPRVDRAAGEVRVSFDVKDPGNLQTLYQSVSAENLSVHHSSGKQDIFELVPHDAIAGGQLFVLVIDKTLTMHENNNERINKVYSALMTESVINSFLPDSETKSGVVLVKFNTGLPTGLDGGPPRVITTRAEYKRVIQTYLLQPSGGYTNLYGAVEWAAVDLLAVPEVKNFINSRSAEPTIVLLTDGFHNESAEDTCGSNVPRLQALVNKLRDIRRTLATGRPRIFTVGLGQPYRKGNKPDAVKAKEVTPATLCNQYVDRRIDRDLELAGIDHVSLQWIAEAGGGLPFVRKDSKGLAEVFRAAAAERYRWYTLYYRVPDSFYHRMTFETRLTYAEKAVTGVKFRPSGWLDGPTGTRAPGDRGITPTPLRQSVAVVLCTLSALVLLTFAGPALFNARRAVFRRIRPRQR